MAHHHVKAGVARAAKLSAARRSEIARSGAVARWGEGDKPVDAARQFLERKRRGIIRKLAVNRAKQERLKEVIETLNIALTEIDKLIG